MLSRGVTFGLLLGTILFAQDVFSVHLGPVISTKAGYFQGLQVTPPGLKKPVYAFVGIPYAKPPIGPLRFRSPVSADFIPGIFSATTKPSSCFQLESDLSLPFPWADTNSSMSEDCLYLNIWTPETISIETQLKPVMVWIHGGGFSSGSSAMDLYDGQILSALGQVVVVTFNYRLGPFGFLDTLTDDIPGNAGLYDQILTLKWVQNNIEYFGGDPKRVTLFGESVGAMSTGLLAVSPLTRGLFHRVILLSGSAYVSPSSSPVTSVESGNQLATLVGCANGTSTLFTNPGEVLSCLRNVPAAELTKTYYSQHNSRVEAIVIYFTPQFWNDVIPKHPVDIFLSGNYSTYDTLCGVTQIEGSSLFSYFFTDLYKEYAKGNLVINKTLAATMLGGMYKNYRLTQSQDVVDFYLKDIRDDEQSVLNAIFDGIGDPIITCPTVYFAEKYAAKGTPVFFYQFDHTPSTSPWPNSMGAAHFEEVQFVFGLPVRYPERYQDEEKTLSEYMIRIWTNFAKSEDLKLKNGTQWPNFSRSRPEYATLQTDQQTVGNGIRKAACEVWRPYYQAS